MHGMFIMAANIQAKKNKFLNMTLIYAQKKTSQIVSNVFTNIHKQEKYAQTVNKT